MFTHFSILSPRGDTIISRDFSGETPKELIEAFLRKVKFWPTGDAPPIFPVDDLIFIHVKEKELYFVLTTNIDLSPCLGIELLVKLTKAIKDQLGMLNEEAIRKNFVLVYELVEEVLDFGFPQTTSTEILKQCIYSETVGLEIPSLLAAGVSAASASQVATVAANAFKRKVMGSLAASGLPLGAVTPSAATMPSSAAMRPIGGLNLNILGGAGSMDQIFVDIIEKVNVLINSGGAVLNCSLEGCIQMKAYLRTSPRLQLGLNDDVVIRSSQDQMSSVPYRTGVFLDDCNFHECCDLSSFKSQKYLTLTPPEGEFVAMNYRITNGDALHPPFRISPTLKDLGDAKYELVIRVRLDLSHKQTASNVVLSCAMPQSTASVNCSSSTSTMEYLPSERRIEWKVKVWPGLQDHQCSAKIQLNLEDATQKTRAKREIGPISLGFELIHYCASRLNVKYLRSVGSSGATSNVWKGVRYVTVPSNYVCRVAS